MTVLDRKALNRATLERQLLLRRATLTATEAVEHLVGLQAQAPFPPYTGLWTRLAGFKPEELAGLLLDRSVVRVALMRGTVHLVTAEDCLALRPVLQPMLARAVQGSHGKQLSGLDLDLVAAAGRELVADEPLTTGELGKRLAARWPGREPGALANAVRCTVPLVQVPPRAVWGRSGQTRVTTAEVWLGRPLATDTAPDAMVLRYLRAFGPATVASRRRARACSPSPPPTPTPTTSGTSTAPDRRGRTFPDDQIMTTTWEEDRRTSPDGTEPPAELRSALAFGGTLREGIEEVRRCGLGTTLVLGHDDRVERLLSGGYRVDEPISAEAVLRAARNDGATVLSSGLDRMVWTNTMLNPGPDIRAVARGTRHVVAERFAVQTARPVVAVSEERGTATLYLGHARHVLRTQSDLRDAIQFELDALRALVGLRAPDHPDPDRVGEARRILSILDGHLVEFGPKGRGIGRECAVLADALGIEWRPGRPAGDDESVLDLSELPVSRDFAVPAGAVAGIPRQLPPRPAHFVARPDHIARLDALLSDGRAKSRIHAVVGGPGMGKTALAVHWAHRAERQFPDGTLYADLRGFHPAGKPADPADVLAGFLLSLNVPESAIRGDLDHLSARYRSELHGKRALVVLDNAADAEQVRPLLPGTHTCGVLVTSRNSLTGLVVKEGACRTTVDLMPPAEAHALLWGIARRSDVDEELAEIARLCGYHPLALAVAGARAAGYEPDHLSEFVQDLTAESLDVLSDPDDHSASVRAAFTLSYRALSPRTRQTFRRLGRHSGPLISHALAKELTGDPQGIRKLVDAHLLEDLGERR